MAFTFSAITQQEPVGQIATLTATTDTSSAAGTFYPGFTPREITVYDITNHKTYIWVAGMAAASQRIIAAAGTQTDPATNGITVTDINSATPTMPTVTLGTDCHTNSSSYVITCRR